MMNGRGTPRSEGSAAAFNREGTKIGQSTFSACPLSCGTVTFKSTVVGFELLPLSGLPQVTLIV